MNEVVGDCSSLSEGVLVDRLRANAGVLLIPSLRGWRYIHMGLEVGIWGLCRHGSDCVS